MTYDNKTWRHWGIKVSAFLAWALKPMFVLLFIILNWQNILPVTGYVAFSVIKIMTGHEYATQEETGYLLYCFGEFSGTAVLAVFCYFFFDEALKRIPFFTYEGDRIRLAREELNRIKYNELRTQTETLEALERGTIRRERDRRLISEFREAFRNLKLEFERLRSGKPDTSVVPEPKDTSLDLFKKKKPPARKRTPNGFVPKASYKKKPPEF